MNVLFVRKRSIICLITCTLGTEKLDVLTKLETQSNTKVTDSFIAAGSKVQTDAGLSQVPSLSTMRHLREKVLTKHDLHQDALTDMILRSQGPNKDFIRFFDIVNFSAILMKDTQLDVLQFWLGNTKFRRACLDATGNIVAPIRIGAPLLHHVLLIPVRVADDKASTPFNLAEMMTSSQSMLTIKHFLENVRKLINDHTPTRIIFHEVITDKSFANIGAILMAFNNLTTTSYLDKCWEILNLESKKEQNKSIKYLTIVRLCSSHTCKTMRDLVRKHFKDKKLELTVCGMIGHLFNINDHDMLMEYCENFMFCLLSPFVGPRMIAAGTANKVILARSLGCAQMVDLIKQEEEDEHDNKIQASNEEYEVEEHNAIYKNSKSFQRLQRFISSCEFDATGEPNKFFNKSFASDFHKCHISYILLWANPMTAIRNPTAARANNGIIENSFHMKKREVRENKFTIGSFGKIKVGRFVKFSSDIVDLRVKKILLNIPAKAHSNKKSAVTNSESEGDVLNSKETYRKRYPRERNRSTFFISSQKSSSSSLSSASRSQSQPLLASQFPTLTESSRRSLSLSSNISDNFIDD